MSVATAITRLIGVELPIVQAPLAWASAGAGLPVAVSRAGGLGVIAAASSPAAVVAEAIVEVRAGTQRPYAVNVPLYRDGVAEIVDLVAAERVPVVITSQGGPGPYVRRIRDGGAVCIHTVSSVEHAEKAAAHGVDALLVVGGEAGGHPSPDLVSSLVLVRAVTLALPGMPVIAAGGFADGYGLAAGLALGAGAVGFGTLFLASTEASVHSAYRRALLAAQAADTVVVGRGLGVVRGLRNRFTRDMADLENSGADLSTRRTRFEQSTLAQAIVDGDVERGIVEAGQAVGLVTRTATTAEIIANLMAEYREAVGLLPPD